VYVSDQVPQILIGDPGRIRQIITNLVGNSIKVRKSVQWTAQMDLFYAFVCCLTAFSFFKTVHRERAYIPDSSCS
jgi:hypothetical protein